MKQKMIFLHGLASSSQAYKAGLIQKSFPELIVPDFTGSLWERMDQLYPILGDKQGWIIIGSSFGGLMGAIFTCDHPEQVRKLVLLAPALMLPEFIPYQERKPVSVPTHLIHGTQDTIVPLEKVREIATKVFKNLKFEIVDDNHGLHKSAGNMDWKSVLT